LQRKKRGWSEKRKRFKRRKRNRREERKSLTRKGQKKRKNENDRRNVTQTGREKKGIGHKAEAGRVSRLTVLQEAGEAPCGLEARHLG